MTFIREFNDLHQIKNRPPSGSNGAKVALKGLSGIYCIKCLITGAMYIGSSIDMSIRLVDHLVSSTTNTHLQNAITKYGLDNFSFCVVEFCDSSLLIEREQYYLDKLFSLSVEYRYNYLPKAGSS